MQWFVPEGLHTSCNYSGLRSIQSFHPAGLPVVCTVQKIQFVISCRPAKDVRVGTTWAAFQMPFLKVGLQHLGCVKNVVMFGIIKGVPCHTKIYLIEQLLYIFLVTSI